MRLLHTDEKGKLSLTTYSPGSIPPYVILSHTWGPAKDEVTFEDLENDTWKSKAGRIKLDFCLEQARKDGISHFWIDTCCINKADQHGHELAEAITSMFRWYKESKKCYVFLSDISSHKRGRADGDNPHIPSVRGARYWTRGWTLQELLAPTCVEFFSREGDCIGNRSSLAQDICEITDIPRQALDGISLTSFTVPERWTWASNRETTKTEDKAYCLAGIFGVSLAPNYGEGSYAFERLKQAIAFAAQVEVAKLTPPSHQPPPHSSESLSKQEHRTAMLTSLSFEQMDSRRSTIKNADTSTCQWFLSHPAYSNWSQRGHEDNQGFLWLMGKPGSGKSTTMKFAVTDAEKAKPKDEIVISFFFNARGDHLESSTAGMYRALLWQIFTQVADMQYVLEIFPIQHWTVQNLCDIFLATVSHLGERRLRCFIDALDECPEEQIRDMVAMLEQLATRATECDTHLYICFASRHYPTIDIPYGHRLILEEQEGHDEDLVKYVRKHLRAGKGKAADDVKEMIRQKASHVFLWVVLVVRILNDEFRRGSIFRVKKRLSDLPPALGELFKDILLRDNMNKSDLLLALQWILFAARPLTRKEFYFGMVAGLEADAADITRWDQNELTPDHMARFVLNSSKGLAELTKSKQATVQFIHESVRDYLINENGMSELWPELGTNLKALSNDELKRCCNNYLQVNMFEYEARISALPKAKSQACKDLRQAVSVDYPFLEYAVRFLWHHAEEAASYLTPQSNFLTTVDLRKWRNLFNMFQVHDIRRLTHSAELAYILAEDGRGQLMTSSLQFASILSPCEERHGWPILAAAANGHQGTVRALLLWYQRCLMDAEQHFRLPYFARTWSKDHGTVLHWAARWGWLDVAALLIDDPEIMREVTRTGETATHYAAKYGQKEVLQLLIKNSSDPEAQDNFGWTPLHCASSAGQTEITALLVAENLGLEVITKHFETALHLASTGGKKDAVQILLSGGMSIDARDANEETALHRACRARHPSVAQLLLDNHAGIDVKNGKGNTVLHEACSAGRMELVYLLLDNHAGIDVKNGKGNTVLHEACCACNMELVHLLLDREAGIDVKNGTGETALFQGCSRDLSLVQLLLLRGADIKATDNNGRTVLHEASRAGRVAVAKLLLNYGVDIDAKDYSGRTALHLACRNGQRNVARLLRDLGADLEAVCYEGLTPLLDICSIEYDPFIGTEETGSFLLESGANLNASDYNGWTALHWACQRQHGELVRTLLNHGASVNAVNIDGKTPFDLRKEIEDRVALWTPAHDEDIFSPFLPQWVSEQEDMAVAGISH